MLCLRAVVGADSGGWRAPAPADSAAGSGGGPAPPLRLAAFPAPQQQQRPGGRSRPDRTSGVMTRAGCTGLVRLWVRSRRHKPPWVHHQAWKSHTHARAPFVATSLPLKWNLLRMTRAVGPPDISSVIAPERSNEALRCNDHVPGRTIRLGRLSPLRETLARLPTARGKPKPSLVSTDRSGMPYGAQIGKTEHVFRSMPNARHAEVSSVQLHISETIASHSPDASASCLPRTTQASRNESTSLRRAPQALV